MNSYSVTTLEMIRINTVRYVPQSIIYLVKSLLTDSFTFNTAIAESSCSADMKLVWLKLYSSSHFCLAPINCG